MRHHDIHPDRLLPKEEKSSSLDGSAIPSLAEDVQIDHYDVPSGCYVLSRGASGIEVELDESIFKTMVPLLDGRRSVKEIREFCLSNGPGHGWDEDAAAEAFMRRVRAEAFDDLLIGLVRQRFVVLRGEAFE